VWTHRGDADGAAGVILGAVIAIRAVCHCEKSTLAGTEQRQETRRMIGVRWRRYDLLGVGMIRGDDQQRIRVTSGVFDGDRNRLVEGDRLADLSAGIGGVRLLVDRRALDLEEEPWSVDIRFVEQRDGLRRHLCQARLAGRPMLLIAAGRTLQI
jgi:hypothetical protein